MSRSDSDAIVLDTKTNESRAFRVADRALVEAVALELNAMEPEIDQQVALQLPRRLVGHAAPAKVRVHGKPEGYAWPDVHVAFGPDPADFHELPEVTVT